MDAPSTRQSTGKEPTLRTILCFGDSNTWGYDPVNRRRYPYAVRWTGVLQETLGDAYRVIEEGLNGRTTVWEDPVEGDKCGIRHLPTCLSSHAPLDGAILMLGVNDLKRRFSVTAYEVSQGAQRLIDTIRRYDYSPEVAVPTVIVVCPPMIGALSGDLLEMFGSDARARSGAFPRFFRELAERNGCPFLDATEIVEPDPSDGLHLSGESHARLAGALADLIRDEVSEAART